jgi:hypothetical protein
MFERPDIDTIRVRRYRKVRRLRDLIDKKRCRRKVSVEELEEKIEKR